MKQEKLPFELELNKGNSRAQKIENSKTYSVEKSKVGAFERLNSEIEKYEKKRKSEEEMRKSAAGREAVRRYQTIKSKVFEAEQNNYDKVIVFASGPGWYKIGGNSAMIYTHMLAPQIGIKPSIKEDRDFYSKFDDGIVSIRHLDLLRENLERIGVKVVSEDPDMVIFELPKPLSKQELKTIRNVRKEREQRVNQIVRTKELYPSIAALMRSINQQIYSKYIHCTPHARTYIVESLARETLKSLVDITEIATGEMPAKETLGAIRRRNERLKVELMILMDMGIFEAEETLRLENNLVDANTQIKSELKKLEK
ncbi:hypothetical protein IJH16_01310 [Candidatus Saccharibacteria bacterium]|nr:hypothetical protein [Candidatus Saccharibacteria bacterium]